MDNILENRINYLDKIIVFFLCIYALSLCLSTAGASIGAGGAVLFFLIRIYMYRGDVWNRIKNVNKIVALGLGIFFIATFISAIFAIDISLGCKTFFNNYIYRPICIVILLCIVNEKKYIIYIFSSLIVSNVINGIWSCGELMSDFMDGNAIQRYSGNLHPVHFGSFLSAIVPALLVLVINGHQKNVLNKLLICVVVFLAICLLITGTRGAWIAVVLSCMSAVCILIKDKKKVLSIFTVVCIGLGAAVSMSPYIQNRLVSITDVNYQSNSERLLVWQSAYEMFTDYPLTGVGIGNYKKQYQEVYISPQAKEAYLDHAHNNFVHILAERGLIGEFAFIIMVAAIFYSSISQWKEKKDMVSLMMFIAWLSYMIQGLTEYNVGTLNPSKFMWLILGLYLSWMTVNNKGMINNKMVA